MDFWFSDHNNSGKKKRFMDVKPKRKKTKTVKKDKTVKKIKATPRSGEYKNYTFKKIKPSKEGSGTKYDAYFINAKNDKEKVVSFGSRDAKYYPDIQDKNYKNFILKHHPIPDNIDLMSKKALERYILWNKTDIKSSIESYKKMLKRSGKKL